MESLNYMDLSLKDILENINQCNSIIKDQKNSIYSFANYILDCSNIHDNNDSKNVSSIFVAGAGRSGFVARAFTMRLMHLGFDAYFFGETVVPPINEGDLVIIVSKSGNPNALSRILEDISEKRNVSILTVGGYFDSDLVKMSNANIVFESIESNNIIMGTAFETASLILLDALVFELMKTLNLTEEDLKDRHDILSSTI